MQNNEYKERVQLLLRFIPIIAKANRLAIHGGTIRFYLLSAWL